MMWAAQTTKTTAIENVLGYFVASDPSPILLVQPTLDMAQAWSKERFNATVRDTPCLRDIISDPKSRDAGNTIQLKTFPGGNLAIIGANAPAGLAGRPRRVVLLDEVDRYPASAGTEGDPVLLAIRRTESFWNSVVYMTSTPTVKGSSRIENEYEQTDKRKWFCPCPRCNHFQTLEWKQIKWESGKPETAGYECENCDAKWSDEDRRSAIGRGEWRPTAPFSGKRGYFLNGICSPFKAKRGFVSRMHQMAAEFLEAKAGGPEQLKTWTNTFLAETWEEEAETLDMSAISSRCESYTPDSLPNEVALVVGGADVQKDRIEVEWVGIGNDDETWGIEAIKIIGDTEKPDTWQRLSHECERKFKRLDGVEIRATAIAIDIHFRPKQARDWCQKHGTRIMAMPVFGIGGDQTQIVVDRFNKAYGQRTWSVASSAAKDIIFGRLKIAEPGPRYCHFPRTYTDEWFKQLTSERAVTRYTKGFPKRVYEKSSGSRNEALDMRVYSLACVEVLRPNIPAIRKLLVRDEQSQAQQPRRGQVAVRRGGGWM
jgi:phage terminase large subunit GpA-like protein